jgi:short-subunit dehydrogenase
MIDYRHETILITGASSGLGAEFARQFAARGASLVLVARREDRLTALAAELLAAHGTVSTVIPFDLSGPRLLAATKSLKVTSLVNNAGYGGHGPFADAELDGIIGQLRLNVEALVSVTHAFLPQLGGILINVASNASYQPVPFMAVYGATKAFVRSFTEALWYETRESSLRVLALSPGSTKTEFFDVMGSEVAVGGYQQEVDAVVATAIKALDRRSPGPGVIPGFVNRAMIAAGKLVPNRVLVTATGKLMGGQR